MADVAAKVVEVEHGRRASMRLSIPSITRLTEPRATGDRQPVANGFRPEPCMELKSPEQWGFIPFPGLPDLPAGLVFHPYFLARVVAPTTVRSLSHFGQGWGHTCIPVLTRSA